MMTRRREAASRRREAAADAPEAACTRIWRQLRAGGSCGRTRLCKETLCSKSLAGAPGVFFFQREGKERSGGEGKGWKALVMTVWSKRMHASGVQTKWLLSSDPRHWNC